MNYLIFKHFSGVGFCNQLFSLETAIYMSIILKRKLILLIQHPLCHIGKADWNYGKFLDFFQDNFINVLSYGFEVHYNKIPDTISDIIQNDDLCKIITYDSKFSQILFIEEHLKNTMSSVEIKKISNYRTITLFNLIDYDDKYLYVHQSNASRFYYNFLTNNQNYKIMRKISTSLKLKDKFYKILQELNLDYQYISIHFRFGDRKHSTKDVNLNADTFTKNICKQISDINHHDYPILIMCDRKDIDILSDLEKKYTVKYTDDIIKNIDFKLLFPEYKSHDVVKFLLEKLICEKSIFFIGTVGSTVSNHIQYNNYLNSKCYTHYCNKIIQYDNVNPGWILNNVVGAGISWKIFFKDNIYLDKSFQLITLTNDGYMELTENLIITLKNLGILHLLKIYCIGHKCYDYFLNNYSICELEEISINNDYLKSWCQYYALQNSNTNGKKKWANITSYKFYAINKELINGNDVIFIDGDIVFKTNPVPYLLNNILDNDLLIQNDEQNDNAPRMCTGFFYIKSNDITQKITNFDMIVKNIENFQNDQQYLRKFEHRLKTKYLPLNYFPNGKYFRENQNIKPYIIHFNYDVGNSKIKRMMNYNEWYIDKIKDKIDSNVLTDCKIIIKSTRKDGFFSCLLGIIYLAYKCKIENKIIPYIIWNNSNYTDEPDDNIFNYFFEQKNKPNIQKCRIISEKGFNLKYITNLANKNSISFRKQFNIMINDICILKSNINNKIKQYINDLNVKNLVGFHLRFTDRNIGQKGKLYSNPDFETIKKNKLLDNNNIYLATDSKSIYDYCRLHYNCKSISNIRSSSLIPIHRLKLKSNYMKAEEALIESILLSNTKKLYRTTSNFTIFSLCLNPVLEFEDLSNLFKKDIEKKNEINNLFIEDFLNI